MELAAQLDDAGTRSADAVARLWRAGELSAKKLADLASVVVQSRIEADLPVVERLAIFLDIYEMDVNEGSKEGVNAVIDAKSGPTMWARKYLVEKGSPWQLRCAKFSKLAGLGISRVRHESCDTCLADR